MHGNCFLKIVQLSRSVCETESNNVAVVGKMCVTFVLTAIINGKLGLVKLKLDTKLIRNTQGHTYLRNTV
jgi:hypothetical protein